jgi:site-specific DNA-methyltransferase (adenine-specific)
MTVLHMDCREGFSLFPENTFDSIVTDPPYELGFMGKAWDSTGIANDVAMWREALRVLKPGGHLLAFSGSRTYHRMTCAIEDAGFEIRDQIMWVYGSGFPKSLDVSKAIDKAAGAEREVIGMKKSEGGRTTAANPMGRDAGVTNKFDPITAPATDAARQWEGWGTALKPAHEPICVARKPLVGTVAANVLAHGTGALNIDGCRVPMGGEVVHCTQGGKAGGGFDIGVSDASRKTAYTSHDAGRWPANIIHDGNVPFPEAGGQQAATATRQQGALYGAVPSDTAGIPPRVDLDKSAARFFYCAKASKADRGPGNTHPTVKPTELMRYLCRLVTPPKGLILDPFAGSGSTYRAATLEGFDFIGFELQAEYVAIANARGRA